MPVGLLSGRCRIWSAFGQQTDIGSLAAYSLARWWADVAFDQLVVSMPSFARQKPGRYSDRATIRPMCLPYTAITGPILGRCRHASWAAMSNVHTCRHAACSSCFESFLSKQTELIQHENHWHTELQIITDTLSDITNTLPDTLQDITDTLPDITDTLPDITDTQPDGQSLRHSLTDNHWHTAWRRLWSEAHKGAQVYCVQTIQDDDLIRYRQLKWILGE